MNLRSRWNEFTGHPDYWNVIETKYGEKGRYYHNLQHIEHCLIVLDELVANEIIQEKEATTLEMAIWFHDIIYDFDAPKDNNETQSAFEAVNFIMDYMPELTIEFQKKVFSVILATVHNGNANGNLEKIMCDIDLSALGIDATNFAANQGLIRKEFARFNDRSFYRGSTKLLLDFLSRDYIYYMDYFRTKYEANARNNIKNRINYVVNTYF